ncbi:hypothetical protein LCM20_12155 [Halobacillus litoralis]|uniref:hypothetical protein n=1 Tax=Halobacillus litoralis TaxID=45668 RepID=UPI001CD2C7EC|nr:hypothetical protein [Halobacillus litoralis]MCA0971350.1 hypothetical protein [Halobacillus litoralis]
MTKKSGLGNMREPKKKKGNSETFLVNKGNVEVLPKESHEKSYKVKMDTVSHVADNVADIITQVTSSIEKVKVASYELEKIRENANMEITKAKEKTKETEVKEKESTKRVEVETSGRIEELQLEFKKYSLEHEREMKQIEKEHERGMHNLDSIEKNVSILSECAHVLLEEMKECRQKGVEVPDRLRDQVSEQMRVLAESMVKLKP